MIISYGILIFANKGTKPLTAFSRVGKMKLIQEFESEVMNKEKKNSRLLESTL